MILKRQLFITIYIIIIIYHKKNLKIPKMNNQRSQFEKEQTLQWLKKKGKKAK